MEWVKNTTSCVEVGGTAQKMKFSKTYGFGLIY